MVKSPKSKKSSVRHTRAIALDRSKRPNVAPPPQEIEQLLAQILQPVTKRLHRLYQEMGLRGRVLTLPVMLAFVISLIWRQLGEGGEGVRVLRQRGLLWQPPLQVSQQAVSERLRELPAGLFEQVLLEVLPLMEQRWLERTRPMSTQLQVARCHFKRVVAVDGYTLDALLKKVGLLRECEQTVLAGKMMTMLDVVSQLPVRIWYGQDSLVQDQQWWSQIIETLEEDSLVLFDLGFVNYERYRQLTDQHKYFVTRVKTNMAYELLGVLEEEAGMRSFLVRVGKVEEGTDQLLRLVEVKYEGQWYQYLTNVVDCARLTALEIAWLYRQRWRIEDAFKTIKRLLGLAYFHGSSLNAIEMQLWASWLLYCIVIDLSDGVAQELEAPFGRISVEMVYRGLWHYNEALAQGETQEVIQYLAQQAKVLGIIKRDRKKQLRT